jgi:hypothetical protein
MRFLVLLSLWLTTAGYAKDPVKPYGKLKDEQSFKSYTVRIYRNNQAAPQNDNNPDHQDGMGCFEILRSGKQVYFQKGIIFAVEKLGDQNDTNNHHFIFGRSIIGDKQPDLVISEINGGNNYLCDYFIFQTSDTFRFIAKIKNTGGGEFKDLRGDGGLELITYDVLTFEGWNCCEAYSPHPTIIYRFQDRKYKLDLEMMKKPGPTEKELLDTAKELKAKFGGVYIAYRPAPLPGDNTWYAENKWAAPHELFSKMLDLIYSGNMASAWKLCDLSWPAKYPGKARFLKEFRKQLETSMYYRDINQASFQRETFHNR